VSLSWKTIIQESYWCRHPHRPKMRLWTDTNGHVSQLGYTDAEILASAIEIARVTNMSDGEYAEYIAQCSECGRPEHAPTIQDFGCIGPESRS
jgi:hypothetical protein